MKKRYASLKIIILVDEKWVLYQGSTEKDLQGWISVASRKGYASSKKQNAVCMLGPQQYHSDFFNCRHLMQTYSQRLVCIKVLENFLHSPIKETLCFSLIRQNLIQQQQAKKIIQILDFRCPVVFRSIHQTLREVISIFFSFQQNAFNHNIS